MSRSPHVDGHLHVRNHDRVTVNERTRLTLPDSEMVLPSSIVTSYQDGEADVEEEQGAVSFDFEWVELPEPAASARARYEECIDLAERCTHSPRCHATYSDLAAPYAYHLNAAGMSVIRTWMQRTCMTYPAKHQPFPPWPFASVEEWHRASADRRDAYNAAERAASVQTVSGMNGIPTFKTLTNGPWIIGPVEIREALDAYASASAEVRREAQTDALWNNWLEWLRETEQHGGFHVM